MVYAGDGEATRELDLRDMLDGGVDVLGGTVCIEIGEEIRWLDGVGSSARSGKVVRGAHLGLFREMILESRAMDIVPPTIMSNIDGSARSEKGENAGIIKASGICWAKLDLEAESESI